jgi:hypothetical protein
MTAGMTVARTAKASVTTAIASPTPNIFTIVTCDVEMATNTSDSSTAAAVTRRPVWPMPSTTASSLSPVRSYSSLMRASRNTS